jgi:hypothetical protein
MILLQRRPLDSRAATSFQHSQNVAEASSKNINTPFNLLSKDDHQSSQLFYIYNKVLCHKIQSLNNPAPLPSVKFTLIISTAYSYLSRNSQLSQPCISLEPSFWLPPSSLPPLQLLQLQLRLRLQMQSLRGVQIALEFSMAP